MSDRTREILAIAEAMFAERGVKQTTVRQICASAGILSGSLYHHFGSKYDLVDAVLREFCDEVLDEYRAQAAVEADPADRLRVMITYAFSLVSSHAAAVTILLNDSADLVRDGRFGYLVSFNDEIEGRWFDTVRAGTDDGSFRGDVDIPLFYRLVRGSILGSIRWYRPGRGKDISRIADEFAEVVLTGILRREP